MKLLGKESSINVRKVLWTCAELNIKCTREDYGSGFASTQTEAFKKLNPNAMIPVWVEHDFVLWESNVICRYLAAGSALLPNDTKKRAQIEQWMDWQATELNNSWRYAFMALARQSAAHQDLDLINAGIKGWNQHISILNEQLKNTQHFVTGDIFSLADIVLGLSVNRWLKTPFEKPELVHVQNYYQRLCERPAFKLFNQVV